ncbi:MAG TPA: hypothetical protein VEK56_07870 [Vicinamibacterales bacterium]|nr:hypothetical protein [Vicinamibacterales bacterium]
MRSGPSVRGLDGGVADNDVFSDAVVERAGLDVDPVGVPRDRVLLDLVAARRADQTDAEVVCRL